MSKDQTTKKEKETTKVASNKKTDSNEKVTASTQTPKKTNTNTTKTTTPDANTFSISKDKTFQNYTTKKGTFRKIFTFLLIIALIVAIYIFGVAGLKALRDRFNWKPFWEHNQQQEQQANNTIALNDKVTDTNFHDNYSKMSEYAAAKVVPSIVSIETQLQFQTPFGQTAAQKGYGSGIIISKDGYILTNNHVVDPKGKQFKTLDDSKEINVVFYDQNGKSKEKIPANIIGTDPLTDLAVLKIDKGNLTPATLGNSDNVKLGQFAMAVGSPLGLSGTVTAGIISSPKRVIETQNGQIEAIQTDASINEGNSGGALVDGQGNVIGINTLKLGGENVEGIGFAIPINKTKEIIKQLIENKKVFRPTIGLAGLELPEEFKQTLGVNNGVLIQSVTPNSPAANAGLKKGDVILKVNGQEINSITQINNMKIDWKIGQEIPFEIISQGKKTTVNVKITDYQPKEEKEQSQQQQNTQNKQNSQDAMEFLKQFSR